MSPSLFSCSWAFFSASICLLIRSTFSSAILAWASFSISTVALTLASFSLNSRLSNRTLSDTAFLVAWMLWALPANSKSINWDSKLIASDRTWFNLFSRASFSVLVSNNLDSLTCCSWLALSSASSLWCCTSCTLWLYSSWVILRSANDFLSWLVISAS